MILTSTTKNQITEHARVEYPREACGLIVADSDGTQVYWPCRNLAEKQSQFAMDPADYALAEDSGPILAVVHSHPDAAPLPSQADLVACERTGIPWFILGWPTEIWHFMTPKGYRAPLIGREFVHGVLDCYTLIRDWYQEVRSVSLLDFERGEDWWQKGGDLYLENFGKAGFEKIPEPWDLQVGDVILMQIRSKVVNHAAIYLGRDQILHHVFNRLSSRDVFGGFWRKNTRMVIRYRGVA